MAKGPAFERSIAKLLSLWWTGGTSDAVFWRTSNSGGRATIRQRVNKGTIHQYGDLTATDPVGLPFLHFASLELKKGYNKFTIQDLLDKPDKGAVQKYEEWITKAKLCKKHSGSLHWLIIVKRDRRESLVFFPADMAADLLGAGKILPHRCMPYAEFSLNVREGKVSKAEFICCTTMESFLHHVTPQDVAAVLQISGGTGHDGA